MGRSIIEKNADKSITIKNPTGTYVDGKATYSEGAGLAMVFDFEQSDLEYFGRIQNGKIFLVSPKAASEPTAAGGKIVYSGTEYDIKGVKTYQNKKGEIQGYRVAVAGAS